MYRLTKLEVEAGQYSAISAGEVYELPYLSLFKYDTEEKKVVDKLQDIDVGWQIYLSNTPQVSAKLSNIWMNTSKIREIVEGNDNYVIFKTQTSTYKLEKN